MSDQPHAQSSPELSTSTAKDGNQAPSPDSPPVPASASKKQVDLARRLGHFLRTYLKSMVLLVTAIIAGVAALLCFPTDAPVAPNGVLETITIDTPFVPYLVYVAMEDDHARNGITVDAEVTSASPPPAGALLGIVVPKTTWGGINKCSPMPSRCVASGDEKSVSFGFPSKPFQYVEGSHKFYRDIVDVFIPGAGFSVAWNNEYVSAILPNVQVYLSKSGNYIREDVPLTIAVRLPGAGKYTWTSGGPPLVAGSYVAWSFTSPPGSAQVNNGVSLHAQDLDTKLIFLAGALLGIAGGALVGAIQEAVKSNDQQQILRDERGLASRVNLSF